jgi:hypothetical protein
MKHNELSKSVLVPKRITHPAILFKANNALVKELGDGAVTRHQPTPENPLGQSGLHTYIDDLQNVIEKNKDNPQMLNKALFKFFLNK